MFEFHMKEERDVVHITRKGNTAEIIAGLIISIFKIIKECGLDEVDPNKDLSQVVASTDSDKKE